MTPRSSRVAPRPQIGERAWCPCQEYIGRGLYLEIAYFLCSAAILESSKTAEGDFLRLAWRTLKDLHSKKWVAAFKIGRISTEDEHRPGRPVESVTQENIDKIHIWKNDISTDRRDLGYSKNNSDTDYERTLGPREAFCPLGSQTFDTRLKGCKEKVIFVQSCPIQRNLSVDLLPWIWGNHFTPESKQQSMQWRHSGSPPPKKAKTVPSAGKVIVSVFWDSEGVLLLDFLNKGQTITGNYYANLVKQLREAIKEKRRGKLSRKIVYHHDNAQSHRSLQAMAVIYYSGFEPLPHAPYSPDLAPSDEEVIDVVTSFFESLETSFFLEGTKSLEHRWKKCIDFKGDYVEK
ncbi:hypothetical protein LAZ67_19001202 [Cordylochernes scorpioides]|uniref:Transposase n=1 Tax=Cordylochernes scorpioides TaxID=51811 RepID=A0ABY6LJ33_9ARAC|nr:hypothetical protein LAZ67_19001202 [Cordylochernes scorpioides]